VAANATCRATGNNYTVEFTAAEVQAYQDARCYVPPEKRGEHFPASSICLLTQAFDGSRFGSPLQPCRNDFYGDYRISDRVVTTTEVCMRPPCRRVMERVFGDSVMRYYFNVAAEVQLIPGKDRVPQRLELFQRAILVYAREHEMLRNQLHAHAPPYGTALVHSRLGDVIEFNEFPAEEIFRRPTCFQDRNTKRFLTMPRSFHKQVADKLKAHFVTHVQLVGSLDHIVDIRGNIAEDAGAGVKSLQYLNLLRLFYQSEGFEVTMRLTSELSTDEDLVYYGQATYFTSALSGFGRLAQAAVEAFEGKIIYPEQGFSYRQILDQCEKMAEHNMG